MGRVKIFSSRFKIFPREWAFEKASFPKTRFRFQRKIGGRFRDVRFERKLKTDCIICRSPLFMPFVIQGELPELYGRTGDLASSRFNLKSRVPCFIIAYYYYFLSWRKSWWVFIVPRYVTLHIRIYKLSLW